MKRNVAIILAIIITVGLAVPLIGCVSEPSEAEGLENQIATVQRGSLTIDIAASGNLALSRTDDLAFEIAGTVEEVLVEEGDTVEEGQVLATLDASSLELAVETAERALTTAEIDLEQIANDFQELITPYPYRTYEFILPESVKDIRAAQHKMEEAREEVQEGISGEQYYLVAVRDWLLEAEEILSEVETRLAWGFDEGIRPTGLDYWTLRAAQLKVDKAQLTLDKAKGDLDRADEELEKAVVAAPFAGFVTNVNVEGGDEVLKGTVAVQLADPNKFEADIMVGEMDIVQVELGGEAWVQVDAMQGLSLPAEITHISPTATISSGVVNYEVKVEVESLETYLQEQQERMQEAMPDISSGELPEHLQQAIEEGSITQEEAEEMMERMQQAQAGQQGQVPTAIPENFQLREGLTVTVSIVVDEAIDVLLVPNSAILQRGMETYAQVVSADGVIEERVITTGISDWQYTEVIDGLSEGEQVVVPQGTTTATTQQEQRPPGGMMIPGMGGHP